MAMEDQLGTVFLLKWLFHDLAIIHSHLSQTKTVSKRDASNAHRSYDVGKLYIFFSIMAMERTF